MTDPKLLRTFKQKLNNHFGTSAFYKDSFTIDREAANYARWYIRGLYGVSGNPPKDMPKAREGWIDGQGDRATWSATSQPGSLVTGVYSAHAAQVGTILALVYRTINGDNRYVIDPLMMFDPYDGAYAKVTEDHMWEYIPTPKIKDRNWWVLKGR